MRKPLIAIFFFVATIAQANNVQLTNISVSNNITNTGKIIEFDVSWENSWRTASTNNWDGVWVFFKFKDNDGKWKHLNFTATNVTVPSGVSYSFGNNGSNLGVGIFLYRSANGSGTFTITNARAGITSMPGIYDIRGFALEMVYIPQGSFYLGDSLSANRYSAWPSFSTPYLVSSSNITMGQNNGNLYDPSAANYQGQIQNFPKGYADFWCMKYELSRGGFRDFLNTLDYYQQSNFFISSITPAAPSGTYIMGASASNTANNGLEIATPGAIATNTGAVIGCDWDADNIFNESTDGEWKVVNYITWPIAAAYLDWAGLRPMTELEFEKLCRGPLYPVAEEYAWGNVSIDTTQYTILNEGMANETINNSSSISGNILSGTTAFGKACRQGIFANSFSNRVSSGAGYYGVMELSGGLAEFCVTTSNAAGRSYNGKHGDGMLTSYGYANENYWPGINGSNDTTQATDVYDGGIGVRTYAGLRERGSNIDAAYTYSAVSIRVGNHILTGAPNTSSANYRRHYGIRGVRDAN